MKTIVSVFLMSLMSVFCFGQIQLDRQVVGSTSHTASAGNIILSSTLGEAVVATAISGTVTFTQGFQQPDEDVSVGIEEWDVVTKYSFFPNPTTGKLFMEFTTSQPVTLQVELYDLRGRKISLIEKKLRVNGSLDSSLDLSQIADGNYQIVLKNEDGAILKSVRIQKVH